VIRILIADDTGGGVRRRDDDVLRGKERQ
jgi:hypothetical protein